MCLWENNLSCSNSHLIIALLTFHFNCLWNIIASSNWKLSTPNLVRCTYTTAIVKLVIQKKNFKKTLQGFQPIRTPWFEKTQLYSGATRLISCSTGNRWEAARWQQVSHYTSFILIPAHGAVKIAHLRVQQQPERKMSSFYIREPDSPTDESPRLLLPPTTTLLGHDEYYNILLHTWRLISLHGVLHCGSHSLRSPAETFRDRLNIRLTNVFHRHSHFWFFNIRSYCHLLGLKDIT